MQLLYPLFQFFVSVACFIWAIYRQTSESIGLESISTPMKLISAPYPDVNNPSTTDTPHLLAVDYTNVLTDQIYGMYGYRFVKKSGSVVTESTNIVWNPTLYKVLDDVDPKAANLGI